MPTEATTRHDSPETTLDQPSGESTLHPNASQGAVATVEVVNWRFDRLEDRLIALERMLGELISARCEPKSVSVPTGPELQPEVTPPQPQADGQWNGEAQSPHVPAWEQHCNDEELDVSVRDYIEQLLKRDNADPPDHPLEPGRVPAIQQPIAASRQDAEAASLPTIPEPLALDEEKDVGEPAAADRFEESQDATLGPASLTPLRPRPERDANLEAMRVVANLSAKTAIRTYERSQAARKTVDRLPLLLIGLICGLMLLYTAFSSGEKSMLVGAAVAFLGAALTAWQVMLIVLRWRAASQPVQDS